MQTTIYWTVQHIRQAAHDLCFRCACWWLRQQINFVNLWLRLESAMPPSVQYDRAATKGARGYVRSL